MLPPFPILLGLSILVIVVGVPLALRRVPPNRWYGLRIPATFADRDVWYEANARTGRDLLALGLVLTAIAFSLRALDASISRALQPFIFIAVAALGVLWIVTRGFRHASNLLSHKGDRAGRSGGQGASR